MNNLLYDMDYQEYIAAITTTQIALGHSVLVIADRVEFLSNVKDMVGEKCMLVTGETSFEERKEIADKIETGEIMCIAGSRQIFSEGISINKLSCVILAVPLASEVLLEQVIGRIMRVHPNKKDPIVIDINFSGHADRKQNNLRLGFYLGKGWQIQSI
jgi:superfamily II DNA or RNA helicase